MEHQVPDRLLDASDLQIGFGGRTAHVQEPEDGQDQECDAPDERRDGGVQRDLPDLPERVSVQQLPAQRGALENGIYLRFQLGVARVGQGFGRELGVRLAAADLLQVDRDEMVGAGSG